MYSPNCSDGGGEGRGTRLYATGTCTHLTIVMGEGRAGEGDKVICYSYSPHCSLKSDVVNGTCHTRQLGMSLS